MRRGMKKGLWLGLIAAVTFATLAVTSVAVASPLVPPGFQLQASNGYRISGIFFDGTPHEERDELVLFVVRRDAAVAYFAPAKADETSVSADLGAVGSVDLHFVPTGGSRVEQVRCGEPKRIRIESGFYEGTVDLHGEEGYVRARAGRVSATARPLVGLVCIGRSSDEGFGGDSPGARLTVHRRAAGARTEFVARKNSPTRVARFEASIEEREGKLGVTRAVKSTAVPAAFDFAFPAKTATIKPGGPFHGTVGYDGKKGKFNRVGGNLSADFPGHSGVQLTGPHTSASMIRYVDNPSHPFDLSGAGALGMPRLAPWLSTRP